MLFDSLNKRIKFLDEVIAQLGLKGISTVHGRAEDGGKSKELREQFDVSVSRAVADLSVLSEYNLINQERLMRSLRSLRKLY